MTIEGPDRIIECPNCNGLLSHITFLSWNSLGARQWTDSKLDGPMFVPLDSIGRCPHCRHYLWLEDATIVGEYMWNDKNVPLEWKQCPKIVWLKNSDGYSGAVQQKVFGTSGKREEYLRMHLWWEINDLIRHENEEDMETFQERLEEFADNLHALIPLLDMTDRRGQLLHAEIFRELGDFEKCLALLADFPNRDDPVRCLLRDLAQEKNRRVQELKWD